MCRCTKTFGHQKHGLEERSSCYELTIFAPILEQKMGPTFFLKVHVAKKALQKIKEK